VAELTDDHDLHVISGQSAKKCSIALTVSYCVESNWTFSFCLLEEARIMNKSICILFVLSMKELKMIFKCLINQSRYIKVGRIASS
jgi:hypothetical protein